MLVDLHSHTKAISHCCKISAENTIIKAKELGFDGLGIANHYVKSYFTDEGYSEWIEKYIAEWNNCEALGKKYSLKIFKAIEVTMEYDYSLHMLIYGADEAFLRNNPLLCDKTLPELYGICKQNGCALVQAHPFRNGSTIQDTSYLDGLEINCHPKYGNSYYKRIMLEARLNGLAVTVGCDYHADSARALGGSYLPDSIETDRDLADYILTSKAFNLKIHEPKDGEIFEVTYER